MKKDPRFPNRPEHPDFAKLSKAIILLDGFADSGMSYQEIVTLLGLTDQKSALYMAEGRFALLTERVGKKIRTFSGQPAAEMINETLKALFIAAWIDGLNAGEMKERNE